MERFDVVIIGAGLAGLQCARLLSQCEINVLLVDRKHDLTKAVHTTGIFVRKSLEDFEFPTGTLGNPVRNVTLYSPKLKAFHLESGADEFRIGKMGRLYESFLQDCIDHGVQFTRGTRYVSAEIVEQETRVKLERSGKKFEVRANVLVGADGANSRVAKDLGLDENHTWIVGREEVFQVANCDFEPRLHLFLDALLAPGYLAWIAVDEEEIHIGVGGYPAFFNPRKALKQFKETVAREFCDLSGLKPVECRGGRIPVGGVLRNIASGNGLLIGDAAGAVSPLTAGGLDPCLRMSAMAANLIKERLRTNDPAVLLRFSGRFFRTKFVSRLWMRRALSVCTNQILLELCCWFLRGKIGSKLATHVFFGRGSFPDVVLDTGAGLDKWEEPSISHSGAR